MLGGGVQGQQGDSGAADGGAGAGEEEGGQQHGGPPVTARGTHIQTHTHGYAITHADTYTDTHLKGNFTHFT